MTDKETKLVRWARKAIKDYEVLSRHKNELENNKEFRKGFDLAHEMKTLSRNFKKNMVLSEDMAFGYAVGLFVLDPEPRLTAWAALEYNSANLFAVHPHVERLLTDSSKEK